MTCTNFRVGWMRKPTKKRLQDIFSPDRNSKPEFLEHKEESKLLILMSDRHGDTQTIAVGEGNRGYICYEHSSVDSLISQCIYTLECSTCEEKSAELVCCDKFQYGYRISIRVVWTAAYSLM
jgi:hypothetical protein